MDLEGVIIVRDPVIPEKMANAQDVMELENVHSAEVQGDWLEEKCGLLIQIRRTNEKHFALLITTDLFTLGSCLQSNQTAH